MKRWIPHPILTLCLLLMWLTLNQSVSLGQLLLGTAIALWASRAIVMLGADRPRIRFSGAIFRLALIVLVDVVRSNIAVGRIILSGRRKKGSSGFIRLPLDLCSRYGLAALAVIITATPGTLWVQYDSGRHILLIHVLDLVDEEAWIQLIKSRYERLLMEIFP